MHAGPYNVLEVGLESQLEACEQLIDSGKPQDALENLQILKEEFLLDSRPYFYSGVAFSELMRLEAALAEFHEALRLEPDRPEYAVACANVASLLGHDSEARESLRNLEGSDIERGLAPEWLWLLVEVYTRLENPAQASQTLDLYARIRPQDPRRDLQMARLKVLEGQLKESLPLLERAAKNLPESSVGHLEMARVYRQLGDLPAALKAVEEAAQRAPNDVEVAIELATLLLSLRRPTEALNRLEAIHEQAASHPDIYRVLGQAYRDSGDLEKATLYLERFREFDLERREKATKRREVAARIKEGEQLLDQGLITQARFVFEGILEQSPENWLARAYLTEIFVSFGPLNQAYSHLVAMERLRPDSPEGNVLAALYWYEKGQPENARSYAQRARKLRPSDAVARNLLGNIYFALGEEVLALAEYEVATLLAPDRADIRANYEATRRKLSSLPDLPLTKPE